MIFLSESVRKSAVYSAWFIFCVLPRYGTKMEVKRVCVTIRRAKGGAANIKA